MVGGHLAGAGLDVVCSERASDRTQRPLFRYAMTHDNLLLTPHIGGCTIEAQQKAATFMAQKLRRAWEDMEA